MSLASSIAGAAAANATKNAIGSVGSVIGKPLESGGSRLPGHSEINWTNFNYPPMLRIIHYDLEELPTTIAGMVRCLNLSYIATTMTCSVNLFNTVIIVASTHAPGKWMLQSALAFLPLSAGALAVFYCGYRGLAEPDATLTMRFTVCQPILCVVYLLLAIVPWGSTNGLAKLDQVSHYTDDGSNFWTLCIIFESILWFLNSIGSAITYWLVYKLDSENAAGFVSSA